jgi:hypothetical protein
MAKCVKVVPFDIGFIPKTLLVVTSPGREKMMRLRLRFGVVEYCSSTWYTTHVCSTVSTTAVSDPLLL